MSRHTFFTAPIDDNGYIDFSKRSEPLRASILSEALNLTCGDRQKDYGDPRPNQALAGKIKILLREYATRDISPEEWESLDMVVSKLSRIVTGPKPKRDNYTDGAAYFSMAGEMALGTASQDPGK